jgi:predicted dehydrogenase
VPSLRKLKTRIVAGELGDLYHVACYQWDEQPPAPSFRTRSGGIFMDMAVHEFDQIRWLSGQEIGRLQAVAARTLSDPPVPGDAVSAQVLCALSGGATALVSLGRRFPLGAGCKVEVFGKRAGTEGNARLPEVRIGIVGYGMMGKAHSYGYRAAPRLCDLPVRPRLRLISGRRRELVERRHPPTGSRKSRPTGAASSSAKRSIWSISADLGSLTASPCERAWAHRRSPSPPRR